MFEAFFIFRLNSNYKSSETIKILLHQFNEILKAEMYFMLSYAVFLYCLKQQYQKLDELKEKWQNSSTNRFAE